MLLTAIPKGPRIPRSRATIDRVRGDTTPGALLGGAAAESRDLEEALAARAFRVVGVVLGLGFLLLSSLCGRRYRGRRRRHEPACDRRGLRRRPCSRTGALDGLLGLESQGYVDAWAPIFFFALIFALAMDYTVFLLVTAKEH